MKIDWKDKTNWVGAVFVIFFFLFLLNRIGNYFDLDKSTWAGWVQAIGSIVAIFAAIYISQYQHQSDRKRDVIAEKNQLLRLMQSLKDELDVVKTSFALSAGDNIKSTPDGEGVPFYMELSDRPFMVYSSYVTQIGIIPDSELRRDIIATYTRFNIFILTLKINNGMFNRVDGWLRDGALMEKSENPIVQKDFRDWKAHGNAVRQGYSACVDACDGLIEYLKKSITDLQNELKIDKG
ncbi:MULTISPECIES: hypothetical protein [Oxalobacteraceae]|uniref:hypothetical protein n=1 Tax=Herminiimonas sp. Marseille-P9896 TaxID=2742211 RepID=UPI00158F5383|nr:MULTISPECIES: hypothetical protein [Oxalobacteraceae]